MITHSFTAADAVLLTAAAALCMACGQANAQADPPKPPAATASQPTGASPKVAPKAQTKTKPANRSAVRTLGGDDDLNDLEVERARGRARSRP